MVVEDEAVNREILGMLLQDSYELMFASTGAEAETAVSPAESLHKESGDEGFTLEHVLGDYAQEERLLESVALRAAIEELPEKEQQVLCLRFYHGLTQSDSARVLHISQVQVSRLERRAVEKLRVLMA